MKLKKVKVAGHVYTIVWQDLSWHNSTGAIGTCDTYLLVLNILDSPRWPETLWHEVGHAIYYEYGIANVSGEEAINGLYMSALHQVLKDNPDMRKVVI